MKTDLRAMTLEDEALILCGLCPSCKTRTMRELDELGHRARVFLCSGCDAFALVPKDDDDAP